MQLFKIILINNMFMKSHSCFPASQSDLFILSSNLISANSALNKKAADLNHPLLSLKPNTLITSW